MTDHVVCLGSAFDDLMICPFCDEVISAAELLSHRMRCTMPLSRLNIEPTLQRVKFIGTWCCSICRIEHTADTLNCVCLTNPTLIHKVTNPPFNRRVPNDRAWLTLLHSRNLWIPGAFQIRPTHDVIEKKARETYAIEMSYESLADFVLTTLFSFPGVKGENGKIKAVRSEQSTQKTLAPNRFPYDVTDGSHHWLMWYSSFNCTMTDEEISADIKCGLAEHLGHFEFEFVWYENPKMTVPDLYHVQVFWHEIQKGKSVESAPH